MSADVHRSADRRRGESYTLHASAGRRRIARLRSALRLAAAAAIVLLVLGVAWNRVADREIPGPGAAAGSREALSGSREALSGPLGSEDGYVPVGASISPFSEEPAISRLDPDLHAALLEAAGDAEADGIALRVNGGWRSARYQDVLLRRAVETYGSVEVARQYALPPAESRHVTGEAVDVGPTAAAAWLALHGSEYGLCQIYENEPWHFELAAAPGGACPAMISNAAG